MLLLLSSLLVLLLLMLCCCWLLLVAVAAPAAAVGAAGGSCVFLSGCFSFRAAARGCALAPWQTALEGLGLDTRGVL